MTTPRLTAEQVARLQGVLLQALSEAPERRDALIATGADLPLHLDDWRGTVRPGVGDDLQDGLDESGDGVVTGEDR